MIITNKNIVPRGYSAITIYPFIFMRSDKQRSNEVLINHEKIHLRQQIELFLIGFYLWYGIDFIVKLIKHRDKFIAYKDNIFEREAYRNEKNLNYLKARSCFAFLKG